ncbi:MAG: hypothetical protein R2796_01595 [Chitinophagaceae bacterium]|nr:hypothetical protein [Chitinophagaceae bacterium]MCB0741421.1 hypothetical protein [Chitinophagaceae bacterium]HQV06378.1 hypothetical protein [Chitinophagaceae bacterium]
MKFSLFILACSIVLLSNSECHQPKHSNVYKGRLELKGICLNYTVQCLDKNIDTSLINTHWENEISHKNYRNVFGIQNPCSFPDSIKKGDVFYFTIDTSLQDHCVRCMAYYPTPPRKLSIKVVQQ